MLDDTYPTASLPASMPLYALLGVWGLVTAFRPGGVGRVALTRVLLVAMAAATSGVLLFGYIADRYLADFLPFVALAGFVGLVDVWRRLAGRGRGTRVGVLAAVAVLGGFGVWANVGAAVTPSALWTDAQGQAFVRAQLRLDPGATAGLVHVADRLPYFAPAGTIYTVEDCAGLYVSTGFSYTVVPQQQAMHETWDPVEQGPGTTHVLQVVFHDHVAAGDPAVTLLTWGATASSWCPRGPTPSGRWSSTRAALRAPGRRCRPRPSRSGPGWPTTSRSSPTPTCSRSPWGAWAGESSTTWPAPARRCRTRPAASGSPTAAHHR